MNEIVIIGGYGSVGRIITQELVDLSISSIQVTVAGRDRENARTFASNFDGTVSGIKFDLQETSSYDLILQDMDMAIMCVDQTDTAFVEACLERGVDYIDVTATDQFFRAVEELDDVAVENEAAAILNVGLMPGVSNLLAVDAWTRSHRSNPSTYLRCWGSKTRLAIRGLCGFSNGCPARLWFKKTVHLVAFDPLQNPKQWCSLSLAVNVRTDLILLTNIHWPGHSTFQLSRHVPVCSPDT